MLLKNKLRYFLSLIVQFIYAVILAYTTRSMDSAGLFYFIPVILIGIPVVTYLMGVTWYYDFSIQAKRRRDTSDGADKIADTEKRKRERLDNVLRDLSDEDLLILQKRLQNGAIDDSVLYDRLMGDDGEIVKQYDTN